MQKPWDGTGTVGSAPLPCVRDPLSFCCLVQAVVGGLPQAQVHVPLVASISTASGDTVLSDVGRRVLVLGVVSSDWGEGSVGQS